MRPITNHLPTAELQALDAAHHMHPFTTNDKLAKKGARIITKSGDKVRLGYVNEANVDPAFPYIEIAERIANRAGVEIIDAGSVRRSMPKKMLGIVAGPREKHSIDEIQMRELNRKHARLMGILVFGLVLLIGFGIVGDMVQPPT